MILRLLMFLWQLILQFHHLRILEYSLKGRYSMKYVKETSKTSKSFMIYYIVAAKAPPPLHTRRENMRADHGSSREYEVELPRPEWQDLDN